MTVDTTEVPIAQTYDANNASTSGASGDSSAKVTNDASSTGGSYGAITHNVDNSVSPVEIVLSPVINKGNSGQKSTANATQSGDTPTMTLLKLAVPIVGAIILYYVTKGKQPSGGAYYGYW